MNVALASLVAGSAALTGSPGGARTAAGWSSIRKPRARIPTADRLLAVGGVGVDATGILLGDSFEIVLKSDAPVDAANIAVHGIGRGAQATGTPAREALSAFREWAAGAARRLPCRFRSRGAADRSARAGIAEETMPWLDLAPLAAAVVPDTYRRGGRSLDDWLAAFGIECSTRHNAGPDALATAELLLRCARSRPSRARSDSRRSCGPRAQKWLGVTD